MAQILEQGRTGSISSILIIGIFILAIAVVAFIVFIERSQRKIIVQYPKRQMGNKMFAGDSSHLPLKINVPGVIPPIFASALLLLPTSLSSFSGMGSDSSEWVLALNSYFGRGQPLYLALYISLIVFFAFFYTAIVFNPDETADNLKKNGGYVPGIRPGPPTSDYLDFVLTRLTAIGATYLSAVCILPEILISKYSIPFYLGGTSLLIVVTVSMDTVAQAQSHLIAHRYSGLIKKTKLRGGRR
jgi:preprotein translocase subunit SecY